MSPDVATEDLLDAQGVAEVLGLAQRNSVTLYQRRYPDMPRPVVDMGRGRAKLWLRPEIDRWAAELAVRGRTRPKRRAKSSQ
jgi:glutathione-regulated potassium-efflux system ancillary protein KefG